MTGEIFIRASLVCPLQCLAVTLNQMGMYQLVTTFLKIDVNSFPVLTLHKERNSNSRSLPLTLTHTHKIDGWENTVYEILFFCAFFAYSFDTK